MKEKVSKAVATIKWDYVILTLMACFYLFFTFKDAKGFFNGDEYTYLEISLGYREGKIESVQYPFMYPLLLLPVSFIGKFYLEAAVFTNLVLIFGGLFILYKMIKKDMPEIYAKACIIFIMFTPILLRHTKMYMAENLMCPLLLITFMYHILYRGKKWLYSLGAGLLLMLCYFTKYLTLILIPVFGLFWVFGYFDKEDKKRSIQKMFLHGIIYGCAMLFVLLAYTIIYCIVQNEPVTIEVIKQILGFSVATGPDRVGYHFIPDVHWVLSYISYAVLGAFPIIIPIIVFGRGYGGIKNNPNVQKYVLLAIGMVVMLIYISSRHSTLAPYNGGGVAEKLLGRYVSYIVPILFIVLFKMLSEMRWESSIKRKNYNFIIGILLGILTVASYYFLYVYTGARRGEEWLSDSRAYDLAGLYTNKEAFSLLLFLILMIEIFSYLLLAKRNKEKIWLGVCLGCSVLWMLGNSVEATETRYKESDSSYNITVMVRDILEEYGDDTTILMTNKDDYWAPYVKWIWQIEQKVENYNALSWAYVEEQTEYLLNTNKLILQEYDAVCVEKRHMLRTAVKEGKLRGTEKLVCIPIQSEYFETFEAAIKTWEFPNKKRLLLELEADNCSEYTIWLNDYKVASEYVDGKYLITIPRKLWSKKEFRVTLFDNDNLRISNEMICNKLEDKK